RGGEARALVRRRQGAGIRERRARRGGAGTRRVVRILLVNWNDRENPHAGGAEIHLHEIFGRLGRDGGHRIDLVTSGWPGAVARGVSPERIDVIYPGVDSAWYSPDAATPRAAGPTFLYVGRLKRYKGVEIALRALAAARQRHPAITLEIAGEGEDRPRLERLA